MALAVRPSLPDAIADFERRLAIQQKILPAMIRLTKPQDWVLQGSGPDAPAYLQASGAQRVKGALGFSIPTEPSQERITLEGGGFAYIFRGYVISRTLGNVEFVVGGRASTEKFFDKYDKDDTEKANRLPVDELDVMKAAYSNFEIRGASSLGGLRGLTAPDLAAHGIPVEKCKGVQYGEGRAGGKGKYQTAPPFGPAGGKPWSELTAEQLTFYTKAAEASLGNAEKSQYHAMDRARLEAIRDEQHKRQQGKAVTP
jgi:hypothetical protein